MSQKLKRYIKNQLENGFDKEEIRDTLQKAGWSRDIIKNTFREIEEKKTKRTSKINKIKAFLLIGFMIALSGFGISYFGLIEIRGFEFEVEEITDSVYYHEFFELEMKFENTGFRKKTINPELHVDGQLISYSSLELSSGEKQSIKFFEYIPRKLTRLRSEMDYTSSLEDLLLEFPKKYEVSVIVEEKVIYEDNYEVDLEITEEGPYFKSFAKAAGWVNREGSDRKFRMAYDLVNVGDEKGELVRELWIEDNTGRKVELVDGIFKLELSHQIDSGHVSTPHVFTAFDYLNLSPGEYTMYVDFKDYDEKIKQDFYWD